MKRLISIFIMLSVMQATSLKAQKATVVDISYLVQYVTGDDKTYQVAVSESFANSDYGQKLIARVDKCEKCAMKNLTIEDIEEIKAHDYDADVDKKYDAMIADLRTSLNQGYISAENFEKYKVEVEKLRAETKKGLADVMKNNNSNSEEKPFSDAELKMPEDPEALIKELCRYAVGGQYYREVKGMGKGLVCMTNGQSHEYKWGVINLLDKEIFPQQYKLQGYTATNNLLVLETDDSQWGLFRYNGECVIPFQKNRMRIQNYHVLMHTSSGDKVLDKNGKTLFSYRKIESPEGFWTVKNKDFEWGVVADDGTVLIPLKYACIWKIENTDYVGGYYRADGYDCDLYDNKTWQLVGKRIKGKYIINKE